MAAASSWSGAQASPSPWTPWTRYRPGSGAQGARAGAPSRSLPSGSDVQGLFAPQRDGLAARKHKGAMTLAGASGEAARMGRRGGERRGAPRLQGPRGSPTPTGPKPGLRGLPARRPQPRRGQWQPCRWGWLSWEGKGGERRRMGLRSASVRACQGQPLLSMASV